MDFESHTHSIEPVFDGRSRALLLGSFPSPKSREQGFFYGHPQNRMWKVLAAVTGEWDPAAGGARGGGAVPQTVEERRVFLLRHGIAMWDVLASCSIKGASDASIRDCVPNDLSRILDVAPVEGIYATGSKAYELYKRYMLPIYGREAVRLPSTSPANAATGLDELIEAYRVIVA